MELMVRCLIALTIRAFIIAILVVWPYVQTGHRLL